MQEFTKQPTSEKTYNRRFATVSVGALALTSAAIFGADKLSHVAADNISKATASVEIPPTSGSYKTFHLGDTFKVGEKQVTVMSLDQAGQLADLPNVLPAATTDMLIRELPKGMQPNEVPSSITFRLPADAEFGNLVAVE